MKRKNMILRFREFWSKLTETEQVDMWAILTALRGPDKSGNSEIKILTTARIRGELFGRDHAGDGSLSGFHVYASYKKLKSLYPNIQLTMTGEHSSDIRKSCDEHFRVHFYAAVCALKRYVPKKQIEDLLELL